MSNRDTSVNLHFYGLNLELRSADKKTVDGIRRDFAYFEVAPAIPEVNIEVVDEKPPFNSLPDLPASIYTLNYVSYRDDEDIYTALHARVLRILHIR